MSATGKQARLYRTVAADIEGRIAAGEFGVGEAIPSLAELTKHYGVARVTACRAVSCLCEAGKLKTVQGVGTFVAEGCPLDGIVLVTTFDVEAEVRDPWSVVEDVHAGVKQACIEAGIPVIAASPDEDPSLYLSRRHGFLLCVARDAAGPLVRWTHALLEQRAPFLCVIASHGLPNHVTRDTEAGTRTGLEYLHGLGHRRIDMLTRISTITRRAVITPVPVDSAPGLDVRLHAIKYADPDLVAQMRENFDLLEKVLSEPDPPTALFVGTGRVVNDVMQFCEDSGIRVPEDLSVLGYCREIFSRWKGRQISRVDNPCRTQGYRGVKELIKAASGGGRRLGKVFVAPEFVEGDSCGHVREPQEAATGSGT